MCISTHGLFRPLLLPRFFIFLLFLKTASVSESRVWFQVWGHTHTYIYNFIRMWGVVAVLSGNVLTVPLWDGVWTSLSVSPWSWHRDVHDKGQRNVVLFLARIGEPSTGNRLPFAPWQIVLKAWQHQIHHEDWPAPSFCQLNRCGSSHNVNKGYVLLQRKRGQNTI